MVNKIAHALIPHPGPVIVLAITHRQPGALGQSKARPAPVAMLATPTPGPHTQPMGGPTADPRQIPPNRVPQSISQIALTRREIRSGNPIPLSSFCRLAGVTYSMNKIACAGGPEATQLFPAGLSAHSPL